mgnify:CR=1 FL=1
MKISVIIPVYNTEKYLKECVESVLAQTYHNLEILLINDGATDSSPQICESYAKQDARIKLIHKENGGLSEIWALNSVAGIMFYFLTVMIIGMIPRWLKSLRIKCSSIQ